MKKAFLMTAMQCHGGCGFMATLNPPSIFPTEESMAKAGSAMHKQSPLICGNPMLIIAYSNVLVSNKLVIEAPPTIDVQVNNPERHNGGQGNRIIVPPGVGGG